MSNELYNSVQPSNVGGDRSHPTTSTGMSNTNLYTPHNSLWQDQSIMARLASIQNSPSQVNSLSPMASNDSPGQSHDTGYATSGPTSRLVNQEKPPDADSYRRDPHQAVQIAASALATLGVNSNGVDKLPPRRQSSGQAAIPDAHKSSKKKRKGKQGDQAEDDSRRKTARACDQCRTKKIRCEIIVAPDVEDAHPRGMCRHCQSSHNECTFYMPITETRFKKRKMDTPDRHQSSGAEGTGPSPTKDMRHSDRSVHAPQYTSHVTQSPSDTQVSSGQGDMSNKSDQALPKAGMSGRPMSGGRVEGPTSISYILHSTSSLSRKSVEEYDMKNHQTWQLTTDDGNGVIRVSNPPPSSSFKPTSGFHASSNHPTDTSEHPILTAPLMSTLVNSYFTHIGPLFPLLSKKEFVEGGNPPPLLLYAIAGVASARRGVKREVFNAIRTVLNGIIQNNDILCEPSIVNVQALLITSLVADLHAQPHASAVSASLTRVSAAIRMAQNLGLHRESVTTSNDPEEMAKIEHRRRVWATCVIVDRWIAACLGLPMMIDIADCDCLLPSPYEVMPRRDDAGGWVASEHQPFAVLTEHLKLTILLGRVLKCVYSPMGLTQTTNEQLGALITAMNDWQIQLPPELKYTGSDSSMEAGLLHLGYVAMQFLFWRTFMRLNYSLPPHIKLSMDVASWTRMIKTSSDAIEWLSKHEDTIDTVFVYAYAINNAALVQYHTWVRRSTPEALDKLKILRDIVQKWEDAVQPDHMSMRRKTIEVMSLLYEAAKKVHDKESKYGNAVFNPTIGVQQRDPEVFKRVVWKPDPDDQGEGVYVATDYDPVSQQVQKELPPGVLVTEANLSRPSENAMDQNNSAGADNASKASTTTNNQPQMNMQYNDMLAAYGNMGGGDNSLMGSGFAANGTPLQSVSYMNINPQDLQQTNDQTGGDADSNMSNLLNMWDPNNSAALNQAQLLDNNMLNGLPPSFDFDAWSEYFNRFDFPDMSQPS